MIVVGTDYRVVANLNMDITGLSQAYIKVAPFGDPATVYDATVSGYDTGLIYIDIPASGNITTGEHRAWAEINYPSGIIQKSAPKTYTIYAEGALQP